MCSWADSLFAACDSYQRGTDCRALLEAEDCTTCSQPTDQEVCMELSRRFNPDQGGVPIYARCKLWLGRIRARR